MRKLADLGCFLLFLFVFSTLLLCRYGIAVRSGHHCTQPLHHHLGINASARASLYIYNTKEEVDEFVQKLKETINFFR